MTKLLEGYCPDFVDTSFTARMEATLDDIARGEADRTTYLSSYFFGQDSDDDEEESGAAGPAGGTGHGHVGSSVGLKDMVDKMQEAIHGDEARRLDLPILANLTDTSLFYGPYGVWAERLMPTEASPEGQDHDRSGEAGEPAVMKTSIPAELCEDLSQLTPGKLEVLFDCAANGGKVLGLDPSTGARVLLRMGPYGPYLQREAAAEDTDDKKLSLTCAMAFVGDDALDLESALRLLALPREVRCLALACSSVPLHPFAALLISPVTPSLRLLTLSGLTTPCGSAGGSA